METIEIPKVDFNPFIVKPVQSEQGFLFHGRERELSILSNMIKHRSPRLCVIQGEEGIGKTSFLNILSNSSSMPVIIDSLQGEDFYQSALEGMYASMIGYEIPPHWRQIEQDLVKATKSYSQSLPIVAIDSPDLPIHELTRLIGRFAGLCKKLDVLAVFSLNSIVYQELPLEAKKHFGIQMKFDRLEDDDVAELINSRMKIAGVEWRPSQAMVAKLSSDHSGNPGQILAELRDIVDRDIFEFSDEIAESSHAINRHEDVIDAIQEEQFSDDLALSVEARDDVPHEEEPREYDLTHGFEHPSQDKLVYSSPSTEFYSSEEVDVSENSDPSGQLEEIISTDETGIEVNDFAFNLDLERLSKLKDDEITELEKPVQNMPSGGLSGLRSRMKSAADNAGPKDSLNRVDFSESTEIWVSEDAPLFADKSQEILEYGSEPESTDLAFDGLDNEIEDEFETDYNQDFDYSDVNNFESKRTINSTDLIKAISQVLERRDQNFSESELDKVVKALLKYNQPKEKMEYEQPLNIDVFTKLNEKEARVLAFGLENEITPSNPEILGELMVKRPRLSQICNKLQKNGVFRSKKIGRSRFFSVTSTARAQMRAWGMLESGGEI